MAHLSRTFFVPKYFKNMLIAFSRPPHRHIRPEEWSLITSLLYINKKQTPKFLSGRMIHYVTGERAFD